MKKWMFSVLIYLSMNTCFAAQTAQTLEQSNIALTKAMYHHFFEKMDISTVDTYHTKDFELISNGKRYDYQAYVNAEKSLFDSLKSLEVVSYDDFIAKGDKVVARMHFRLVGKDGKINEFEGIMIGLIKNNKFNKVWELTYPNWE